MLSLKRIVKNYKVADLNIEALKGIDLEFRKNEFVSILGQSGCGKTTMLNIIGGLDRYTSGDLFINGVSTKEYKDADWDIYRNNSIGFVFQTYNLISHQTVLSNVELALTLSGVSKAERRRRAVEVLTKVGLSDQINKKPNQMSGGQMQRVAIARALINNPDILLADEPTGALDSETSIQIMELLKEIALDRLVIMVTHNPLIAEKYSTRIIKLLDGRVIGDSDPYTPTKQEALSTGGKKSKVKKVSMSFFTALSLSLNNLLTKKTRTVLTAFAGSIGIIGIALILSLSSGMQEYINGIEKNTLSTYPITFQSQTMDMTSMMATMMTSVRKDRTHDLDKIYSSNIMTKMMETMFAEVQRNDLQAFKSYLRSDEGKAITDLTNSIQYSYGLDLMLYKSDTSSGVVQVNPSSVFEGMGGMSASSGSSFGGGSAMMSGMNVWNELLDNEELEKAQYEMLAGNWPVNYNDVILFVDSNNEISDMALYSLGLLDANDLRKMIMDFSSGKDLSSSSDSSKKSFTYEELLDVSFKLIINTDIYEKTGDFWVDMSDDAQFMKKLLEQSIDVNIVGIARTTDQSIAVSSNGGIGYKSDLVKYVIGKVNDSEIVRQQKSNPDIDVLTGKAFVTESASQPFDVNSLTDEQKAALSQMSEQERTAYMASLTPASDVEANSYEDNITKFGVTDLESPDSISLFPKNFESKEKLQALIEDYNTKHTNEGNEHYVINYTDIVGTMMSSVSSVINIVTYVLIAFVAISLVVSSIMIGIITYISVLERTKEIGILRSIGASKGDISRVFNAETVIVGFVAGAIGILATILMNLPINAVIHNLTNITGLSSLPLYGAVGLIAISVILTVIAGLVPSRLAAKKDPVVALRTE